MASLYTQQGIFRFGQFELDRDRRELRRSGNVVRLQRQQFAVLLLLVERAGQTVSREEIRQQTWGNDTFVDFERGINFAINQIRGALGDNWDNPRFIETVPRHGYRFIAPIEGEEPKEKPEEKFVPDRVTLASTSPTKNENQVPGDVANPTPAAGLSFRRILAGGLLLFATMGTIFTFSWGWQRSTRPSKPESIQTNVRTVPLTTMRGAIYGQTFSPDGRQIAFTLNSPNPTKRDIYVQLIDGGGRPFQITHTENGIGWNIDWSPDGRLIAFCRFDQDSHGTFYTIAPSGGPERKLADVGCGEEGGTWTPDGKSFLFTGECTAGGPSGIKVLTVATGQTRCLAAPQSAPTSFGFPLASPDGSNVAFIGTPTATVQDVYVVPFTGGTPRRLTFEGRFNWPKMWSKDGHEIVFYSDRSGSKGNELWRVSVNGGPILPESTYPRLGVVSRDGRRLADVDYGGEGNTIWRASLSGPGGKLLSRKQITDGKGGEHAPQLSPDGRHIAFQSGLSGALNIWTSDIEGANPIQLTSFGGGLNGTPRWSPDGKWIAFDRRATDHAQIGVIDAEGGNLRVIAEGTYDNNVPTWSRDGKSIYFSSNRTGPFEEWKHDMASGTEAQITQHGALSAFESYDGRDLYYVKPGTPGIWRMPIGGGAEQQVTKGPAPWYWGNWDLTDTGLYFLDTDGSPHPEVAFYDFKTRMTTDVFQLENEPVWKDPGMSASRDGHTVVYNQTDETSTIMIVENFQ